MVILFLAGTTEPAVYQPCTLHCENVRGWDRGGFKVPDYGQRNQEVQLQNGGNKVSDALVRLFRDDNLLRMVNEVAKAVFHSDCRVYEWVEKNLRDDRYKSVEDVLRDAVDYVKYSQ